MKPRFSLDVNTLRQERNLPHRVKLFNSENVLAVDGSVRVEVLKELSRELSRARQRTWQRRRTISQC